jgi:chromosome partitioning protein
MLRQMGTIHSALLVKVDRHKQRLAQNARQILDGFGVDCGE